jgi:hypothetical protein
MGQGERTGHGTFANASALNTTASFQTAGTYGLRLSVSDGALTASDDMTVVADAAGLKGQYSRSAGLAASKRR